ncbi:hypothetical protein AMJ50_00040 [Parcubacteria bacterium DG_74_3]|nr:MAG: hypothetical protein AMJ50_00040 [Parcubacteria bacterium DG_74_3]
MKISQILTIFTLGIVGGIFADQILWPYFIERPLFYQYRLEQNPIYVTEKKEITIRENLALQNAVEKVEKVVVGVKTKTETGQILEGSGLIITSDGLIVTLAELVPKGSIFSFFVSEESVHFQILKRDSKENLALIKIDKTNLSTLSFANLEKIRLGERVFLVGIVFEKEGPQKIVNEGIIRTFSEDLIETSIFEENVLSGSPLFDIEGNILGLNETTKEGQVLTIPISKIREFTGL